MQRGLIGRYEISLSGNEKVRAFVPDALPPDPPLDFNPPRLLLLERATLALGRLDSITLLLPDPDIFLYAYVRREAVLSSQIEGTQSTFAQLLLFELDEAPGVPIDDVVEASNYVAALNHGLASLSDGFPLSNRLIREMHARLLRSGRGSHKNPGEFRRSQNWIGGTRPGSAHYVPPPPDQVQECMADLERFLHNPEKQYPALIRAALAHAQFETIHPFLDGNGRIGRLLIAFILHHEGVLKQPLLYLSLFLKQHRAEYYRLLDIVRLEGDWEAWVAFFLEGVEQTASGAVDTALRLVALFKEDEERIMGLGRIRATALRTFGVFCRRPIANLTQIAEEAGISYPTASKRVETLIELGIVRELTGQRRNRVFAYNQHLEILNEGTEPL